MGPLPGHRRLAVPSRGGELGLCGASGHSLLKVALSATASPWGPGVRIWVLGRQNPQAAVHRYDVTFTDELPSHRAVPLRQARVSESSTDSSQSLGGDPRSPAPSDALCVPTHRDHGATRHSPGTSLLGERGSSQPVRDLSVGPWGPGPSFKTFPPEAGPDSGSDPAPNQSVPCITGVPPRPGWRERQFREEMAVLDRLRVL